MRKKAPAFMLTESGRKKCPYVKSITILAPNRVVLCGRLFQDEEIRERMIEQCKQYDAGCDEKRIIYSVLAEKEDYIGSVAAFVQEEIF